MINTALMSLTQPFSTVYDLCRMDHRRKDLQEACYDYAKVATFADNYLLGLESCSEKTLEAIKKMIGEELPFAIDEKICTFVADELKMDPKNFHFRLHRNLPAPVATRGSIRILASNNTSSKGFVFLSPEFVDEMQADFSEKHKFSIAHELGHLEADDLYTGALERERISLWTQSATYPIAAIVAQALLPGGMIGIHLTACAAAKCAAFYQNRKLHREMEFKADEFAAKKSPQIARGILHVAQEFQSGNLKVKTRWIEKLGQWNPFVRTIGKAILNCVVDKEGDLRLIGYHPSWTNRVKRIAPFMNVS